MTVYQNHLSYNLGYHKVEPLVSSLYPTPTSIVSSQLHMVPAKNIDNVSVTYDADDTSSSPITNLCLPRSFNQLKSFHKKTFPMDSGIMAANALVSSCLDDCYHDFVWFQNGQHN